VAGGGWGIGGWGVLPWGESLVAAPATFDLFCFQGPEMFTILADPNVTTLGNGAEFFPNPITFDLEVCSGDTFPTDDARVIITENVPQTFTVEWIVRFRDLPNDFTNLQKRHIYLGCFDAAGPVVGFFFSKTGIAYTGSVSFTGSGDLQLDCTFQVIPGSADYVSDTDYLVIRAAADIVTGLVYFYVTPLAEVPITGQKLRAILPVIPASAALNPPTDQSIVSVRGTVTERVCAFLSSWCLGTALIIPNLAPMANAGLDQAVRACSIIQLNGSHSFDPEGASLVYQWRLIDVPIGSEFGIEKSDGMTVPLGIPTGFTDKFHSTSLGVVDVADPIDVGATGDVLLVDGIAYTIVNKGTDVDGFYVQIGQSILPDSLSGEQFKVLRQRGLSNSNTISPTFFPDEPGFYRFDLVVSDGALLSEPSVVIVNVLESPLPRGCTPDLSFIFNYLSDFWNLVEGRERLATFWSSLAQVAASELFTLWQIDYSKSHRDIQRTFNRRWLHYDLLLGEPLPELTKTRAIFGGVTSSFIDPAGQGGINGTALILSSPVFAEDVSITIRALNPVTADALAAELQSYLQANADSRFTTFVIEDRTSGDLAVRIDAPFPFTVSADSTIPVFTDGDESRPPSGSGAGVGSRTYKVDRSLEELSLEEDDYLILDGQAFLIARVIDEPSDQLALQRIVVKEDLPVAPSTEWQISGWVSSELLDFYNGLVFANDHADFEVVQATTELAPTAATNEILSTTVLGASADHTGRLAVDFWPIGAAIADEALLVHLARVVRRRCVPVHVDVLDVPTLQDKIVIEDDTSVLRRNVDFYIEDVRGGRGLRFVSGEDGDIGDVWEGGRPPDRLWAEYTYFDNSELIEANFGIPVDLTADQLEDLPEDVDYLSAVRGLWYAFFNGPTVRNLRIGIQILLGLPFAEHRGTIEEIRTDFSPTRGRMLIRDIDRSEIVRIYRWPRVLELEINPETGERYKIGDTVEEFAPLVEGATVADYVNDPRWFEGILNQGIFFEVEKFHRFLVRVDEAAFSLSALLFVRNFVLKIKPTYTFPLFVVQKHVGDTEVSTTDLVIFHGKLMLSTATCEGLLGASYHFDQPHPAGGGWRNQFDADVDPYNAPPTFPVSEPVSWGYDKAYLCPENEIIAINCEEFAAPFTIQYDTVFAFDTPVSIHYDDWDHVFFPFPPTIASGGFTIPYGVFADVTVPKNGTLTQLRMWVLGEPGTDPTDYRIVIQRDTGGGFANYVVENFTAGLNTEIVRTISAAVNSGDKLKALVQPASGGVARTPNWTRIAVILTQSDAAVWTFDTTLPAGEYCLESSK
jgi:hypothetical protein